MRLIDADELLKRIENGKENVMNRTDETGLDCILLGFYSYIERLVEKSETVETTRWISYFMEGKEGRLLWKNLKQSWSNLY